MYELKISNGFIFKARVQGEKQWKAWNCFPEIKGNLRIFYAILALINYVPEREHSWQLPEWMLNRFCFENDIAALDDAIKATDNIIAPSLKEDLHKYVNKYFPIGE